MKTVAAVGFGGDVLLEVVVARTLERLAHLKYEESVQRRFARSCRRLMRFARERGGEKVGVAALGERYLQACRRRGDNEYRRPSGQRIMRHAIRVLTEVALHGSFELRGKFAPRAALPTALGSTLTDYRQFSDEHLLHRRSTVIARERGIRRFFLYVASRGIESVAGIDSGIFSAFVASRTPMQPTSLEHELSSLRSLMRFLLMRGLVSQGLVDHVRAFRVQCTQPLPAVWRREDVVALLAGVDRSSPVGKRDYAILLLAAQLGLRGGDIRQLRLEHILWDQSRIEFQQSKTGGALALPMSEELGVALIDYLRNGRPPSARREVFLRAHAPFLPLTNGSSVSHVMSKYRQLAGVRLAPLPSRRGLHSLRHSLASRLIEAGTPLGVIAAILGHRCQESTQSYIRIDVEALRDVALGLEEVGHDCA